MDPFLGEIKLVPYNFAPRGWAFCSGQLLSISQNTALFALLGTTYGGNGQTNFALPDLQGRVIVGPGPNNDLGEKGGVENVSLLTTELPSHTHDLQVSSQPGTLNNPVGAYLAESTVAAVKTYAPGGGGTMPASTITNAGGSAPHDNMQPYLTLNYVIALQGIFPSRS